MSRTSLPGIENPTPWNPGFARSGVKIATLIPMISPRRFTSGPPELPGLIAASVWNRSRWLSDNERSFADTIPWVTVSPSPNGLPTANTSCPTSTSAESPNFSGVNGPGASILSTAMSNNRSSPIRVAGCEVPSWSVTWICCWSAITWWLVTTWPSWVTITPEPWPWVG